jgi:hypothetical protein
MYGRIHVLKKLTAAGIVAAAASGALLMASPAGAATDTGTNGNGGVFSGNQVIVPVSIPVDVCGDSIAILGISRAGCRGGASVGAGQHHHGYHHPWDS